MSDLRSELTVADELADRQAQRNQIAALFKARPLAEIEPDELRAITPHYQQRISECLRAGMTIKNVSRTVQDASGRTRKRDGAYRYQPHGEAQGRDASQPTEAIEWPTEQGRPFQPDFRLT